MVNRIRGIRGFALLLAALAVLCVGSVSTQAALIVVDPGPAGFPAVNPIAARQFVSAGDPVLDVQFDLMKHIEATDWGFEVVSNRLDDPFDTVSFRMFLTDEFGDLIPGTDLGGVFAPLFDPRVSFGPTPPTIAHDFHVDFGFGSTFDALFIDVFVDGRVGVWGIPEPSTLTLFGAGLLGLALLARRRRKAA